MELMTPMQPDTLRKPATQFDQASADRLVRWQMLVCPRPNSELNYSAQNPNASRQDSDTIQTRPEISHPFAGPHYPLCWSQQVGLQEASASQQTSTSINKTKLVLASGIPRPHVMFHDRSSSSRLERNQLQTNASTTKTDTLTTDLSIHEAIRLPNFTSPQGQTGRRETSQALSIANEIRVPLRMAATTVQAFAQQVQSNNYLTLDDAQQLSIASVNLHMVSRWMESLGLAGASQPPQLSHTGMIRCRFRLAQWRAVMARTLEEVAKLQQVKLDWIGWDMALPDLYLDAARLSQLLFHLTTHAVAATEPGGKVVIRAGWKDRLSERIVLWVEYFGQGLSSELMRSINRVSPWQELPIGTSLTMAAKLIGEIGGSISAQTGSRGGTAIGVLLPVDQCGSLVRSWLSQNAFAHAPSGQNFVNIYAVGCEPKHAEQFNLALQSVATTKQFVYQVTAARWLVLELKSPSGSPESKLLVALQKLLGSSISKLGSWKSQSVYRSRMFTFDTLLTSVDASARLPQLASQIAKRMQQSIGEHELITQPITFDRLTLSNSDVNRPVTYSQLGAVLPDSLAAPNDQNVPGQQVVSEIVKQWKLVQSKLSQLHNQLNASQDRRTA